VPLFHRLGAVSSCRRQTPGHKGMIYREPYGVALIIGPFNGPLLLLIRPALAALAAGNTCVLTLSEALPATTGVLLELVPKYFDPSAVTAVPGGKDPNTELLKLPFDFIFSPAAPLSADLKKACSFARSGNFTWEYRDVLGVAVERGFFQTGDHVLPRRLVPASLRQMSKQVADIAKRVEVRDLWNSERPRQPLRPIRPSTQ
jgi:hypothetical protein